MQKLKPICIALVIAFTVISCSGGGDDASTPAVTPPVTTPTGGGGTVTNPTYTANIKSIIDGSCISCHSPGGENSSVPLQTYAQVSGKASLIKTRIEKSANDPLVMPKKGKLSQANIDLINTWIANGMPN